MRILCNLPPSNDRWLQCCGSYKYTVLCLVTLNWAMITAHQSWRLNLFSTFFYSTQRDWYCIIILLSMKSVRNKELAIFWYKNRQNLLSVCYTGWFRTSDSELICRA